MALVSLWSVLLACQAVAAVCRATQYTPHTQKEAMRPQCVILLIASNAIRISGLLPSVRPSAWQRARPLRVAEAVAGVEAVQAALAIAPATLSTAISPLVLPL